MAQDGEHHPSEGEKVESSLQSSPAGPQTTEFGYVGFKHSEMPGLINLNDGEHLVWLMRVTTWQKTSESVIRWVYFHHYNRGRMVACVLDHATWPAPPELSEAEGDRLVGLLDLNNGVFTEKMERRYIVLSTSRHMKILRTLSASWVNQRYNESKCLIQ